MHLAERDIVTQDFTDSDTPNLFASLTPSNLSDDKDIKMDILADEPAAHVDVQFLGLVFLLCAALDDVGPDGIALVVIFVDVIGQFAQCRADGLVGRVGQRLVVISPVFRFLKLRATVATAP